MRVSKVLKAICGFGREVVIISTEVLATPRGRRGEVEVFVRPKRRKRGRCGRCGASAPWLDNGGGARRWRHLDAGIVKVWIVAVARRVDCAACGPTVAAVPWARHDSAFTRAFEDLVVHDAIVGNKQAAADRYGVSWRAVNNMCVRVATEALGRVDLLDGLVADRDRRGQVQEGPALPDRRVRPRSPAGSIWAAKGRSQGDRRRVLRRPRRRTGRPAGVRDRDGAELDPRRRRRTGPGRHRVPRHLPRRSAGPPTPSTRSAATSGTRCAAPAAPGAAKEFKGLRFLLRAQLGEPHRAPTRGAIRDAREREPAHLPGAGNSRRNFATSSPCRCSPPAGRSTTGSPTPSARSSHRS